MRKGIKKWHSNLAKLKQAKKTNSSLYLDNQILKQFIIDIYHATANHTNLTIQQNHFKTFKFLEDANIINLQHSHTPQDFIIPKPHQRAKQIQQEKRDKDQTKLNDYFNSYCGTW